MSDRSLHRIAAQGLYDPAQEHDACGVGFVANIRGERSHAVVHRGVEVLVRLEHRGACGCDPETGDGAGILIQLPDRFLRREAAKLGIELPELGRYASGLVFLSRDASLRAGQVEAFERAVAAEGQRFLGWREVPIDPAAREWFETRGLDPVAESLGAGDDYELLFAVKPSAGRRLASANRHGGVPITRIGRCTKALAVTLRRAAKRAGVEEPMPRVGFVHFRQEP